MEIDDYVSKEEENNIMSNLVYKEGTLFLNRTLYMIRHVHTRILKYSLEKNIDFNLSFKSILNCYLEIEKNNLLSKKEKESIDVFLNTFREFNIERYKNPEHYNFQFIHAECIGEYDFLINAYHEELNCEYEKRLIEKNLINF